jgi:hypothetical protein
MNIQTFYFNYSSLSNKIIYSLLSVFFIVVGIFSLLPGNSEISPFRLAIGIFDLILGLFFYFYSFSQRNPRLSRKTFLEINEIGISFKLTLLSKFKQISWENFQKIDIQKSKLQITLKNGRSFSIYTTSIQPDQIPLLILHLKYFQKQFNYELTDK